MKKSIIVAIALCIASIAQAANVKWGSSVLYAPDKNGALSSTKITTASGFTVTAFAWESLSDITSFKAGSLYDWYSGGKVGQAISGLDAIQATVIMNANGSQANATGIIGTSGNEVANGTTVYGAVLYVLSDANGDLWYMENYGSKATGNATVTVASLGSKIGGIGAATSWTAVPEPTSGILLLLGMAGLALRRKRA